MIWSNDIMGCLLKNVLIGWYFVGIFMGKEKNRDCYLEITIKFHAKHSSNVEMCETMKFDIF